LVYRLLDNGIPVHWVVASNKAQSGNDIQGLSAYLSTASASSASSLNFAGGPFVIDAADAADATPIITAWQATGWDAVAYITTTSSSLEVSRTLFLAPTIAIYEDGKEDIAWGYLNAAGIPDAAGNTWTATSSGNLSAAEISGSSSTVAGDGALFSSDGYAAYCHLNAMHASSVSSAVVQEMRAFAADFSTSSLFECDAAKTIENNTSYGRMLSTGLTKTAVGSNPTYVVGNPDDELVQTYGNWGPHGGSLPSFTGTFNSGVRFISGRSGSSTAHVLAYGYLDGNSSNGKVSFLGAHEYSTTLPYTTNNEINGVRVFLNSYFTANCADQATAPDIQLAGTTQVVATNVSLELDYNNAGQGRARSSTLTLQLPAGLSYVSDNAGGVYDAATSTVTWTLATLDPGETGVIQVELTAAASGSYALSADLDYTVDSRAFSESWSGSVGVDLDSDGDGLTDEAETGTYGTDPNNADTDGDGLGDATEIMEEGTDPNDADTDGDGLEDGGEVNNWGTDPLQADTDGDGLL
ncbi:MAG TPA: hypothetical protein PKY30_16920, partial [Myxococcota bacterium]|nr:hypothetical protein [Myxococcota bacterium]